jgi:uncharacterized protein (TIGR02145 family)
MEYGKTKLIRLLANTPREGWNNQKLKDLIDSLWRDPVVLRWSGFEYAGGTDTVIAWDNGTKTFSIAPLQVTFGFYQYRHKLSFHKRSQPESIDLSGSIAEGRYIFFYSYDDEKLKHVLSVVHNPTAEQLTEIYLYKTEVANLYYDATLHQPIHFGDDRHGSEWQPQMHLYLHEAFHARRKSGLVITGTSFGGDGSDNAHAKFSVVGGTMLHDDIELAIPSSSDSLPILYQQGFLPRYVHNSGYAIYRGASRICFNTGGAIVQASTGNYVLYHIFATNEIGNASRKIISVMGSAQYTTLADAYAAAPAELDALDAWMPQQGRLHIDTIVVRTDDAYTNSEKAIIVSTIGKTHPPVTIAENTKQLLEITDKQELSIPGNFETDEFYALKNRAWQKITGGGSGEEYEWTLSDEPEIVGYLAEPSNIVVQIPGSGTVLQSVPQGAFFQLSAINENGETLPVPNPAFDIFENTPPFENMALGDFIVSWGPVEGAVAYRFYMPGQSGFAYIETAATSLDMVADVMGAQSTPAELPAENTAAIIHVNQFSIENGDTAMIVGRGIDVVASADGKTKTVALTKQQSDWGETDPESPNFIPNKPTVPAQQVQSDWDQSDTEAPDFIRNKPTIPTGGGGADIVAGLGMDFTTNQAVDLGLPSTIDSTTENTLTETSHTHKLGNINIGNLVTGKPVEYGALYNWWAITDVRKLTSSDIWEYPSIANWRTLFSMMDTVQESDGIYIYPNAGKKLKEEGIIHWLAPNEGTNEFNFSAKGTGIRDVIYGDFIGLLEFSAMYSSDDTPYSINIEGDQVITTNIDIQKNGGSAARFVRPATEEELLLPNGTYVDNYIGNDGKIYKCVKIGTQVWLADNLNETKYRNGDWITGIDGGVYTPISNAAWAALTTEAMCYYDDNEAYGGGETPLSEMLHPPVTIHPDSTDYAEIGPDQVLTIFPPQIPEPAFWQGGGFRHGGPAHDTDAVFNQLLLYAGGNGQLLFSGVVEVHWWLGIDSGGTMQAADVGEVRITADSFPGSPAGSNIVMWEHIAPPSHPNIGDFTVHMNLNHLDIDIELKATIAAEYAFDVRTFYKGTWIEESSGLSYLTAPIEQRQSPVAQLQQTVSQQQILIEGMI